MIWEQHGNSLVVRSNWFSGYLVEPRLPGMRSRLAVRPGELLTGKHDLLLQFVQLISLVGWLEGQRVTAAQRTHIFYEVLDPPEHGGIKEMP